MHVGPAKDAQHQHENQLVADKPGHGCHGKAAQTLQQGRRRVLKTQPTMA